MEAELKKLKIGSVRRFGNFGVSYIVGKPEQRLTDGDWLINIEVIDSGEKTLYRLSKIMKDPVEQ